MNGTNYNQPCIFAEKTVEYIYDEMNGDAKTDFESHVAKCGSCADELAGFGLVRAKVSDWKTSEFLPATTPIVEIPAVELPPIKRNWFDNLRDLVMLSPAWMTQTAAFATLAICFGLAYFAINSPQNTVEIDYVPPPSDIAKATPNVIPTPPIKVSSTPQVDDPKPLTPKSPVDVVKTNTPSTPKKVIVQAVQTELKQQVTAPKIKPNRGVKPTAPKKQTKVDLLTNDVEEDDSLRLSDLFDEVSMK